MPTADLTNLARAVGLGIPYKGITLCTVIANGEIGALVAGSFTSTNRLRNDNHAPGHWSSLDARIAMPFAATAADMDRPAGVLTPATGLLDFAGADRADTTLGTESFEIWLKGVRRDTDVLNAINDCRAEIFFDTYIMVSHATGLNSSSASLDGDMALSATTAYSSIGTPTLSKSTDPYYARFGLRALRALSSGADEGAQGPTILATSSASVSRRVNLFSFHSAAVGGVRFMPYDVTNSAEITGYRVENSEEEGQLLVMRDVVLPATCERVAVQWVGLSTTSDNYMPQYALYKQDNMTLYLPPSVTENYQVPELFYGIPKYETATNVWNAASLKFESLKQGKDYQVNDFDADPNPNSITMLRTNPYQYPIFAKVSLPLSYLGDLSAETDVSKGTFRQIVAGAQVKLIERKLMGPEFAGAYRNAITEYMRYAAVKTDVTQEAEERFWSPTPWV